MANKYITKDELRNKPYDILSEEIDNTFLEVLQDITKDMIDKLCHQSFDKDPESGDAEYKFDGNGKARIFINKIILSLTEIRVYTSATSYVSYDSSNFVVKTNTQKGSSWITWNQYTDVSEARYSIGIFEKGVANVGIVGQFGWATPPNPIKYLQGRLIQKAIERDELFERLKSQKTGDFNSTLLLSEDGDNPTGDYEMDIIIKNYRSPITYAVS